MVILVTLLLHASISLQGTLSTWFKWTNSTPGFEGRTSGSVCGQDPKYCTNPASTAPFVWEDDITQWPVSGVCCSYNDS